jgi:hypothetical protein
MRPHPPSIGALGLLVAGMFGAPSPAMAAGRPAALSALTLSPTASAGVARERRVLGPFSLRNDTRVTYDIAVDAVLLGQDRNGVIVVRDDPESRRSAARLLGLQLRRFTLPAAQSRSVSAVVRRVGPRQGIYAGMLFSARPRARAAAGAQITNVLRLDAGQLLAPRDPRPSFSSESIRADQTAPHRLRLEIPIYNDGNVLGTVTGSVDVLDARDRRVLRASVGATRVLPGATVDVPAALGGRLAAGRYTLHARLRIDGAPLRVDGAMDLFGVNTVRAQDARLTGLDSPNAIKGSPVTIAAGFRNTGNVPYAPGATVEVRPIDDHGALGATATTTTLQVQRAAPGREGRISGSVSLPEGRAFQLHVRLMAGARELDQQSVRVDVRERPSLASRLTEFLRANALVIIAVAFAGLLAGAAFTIRYVSRLKARLTQPSA